MVEEFSEKIDETKAEKALGTTDGGYNSAGAMDEQGALDGVKGQTYEVGISKDGTKLHPQPTADALDPLNWTSFKKHTILAIVMYL